MKQIIFDIETTGLPEKGLNWEHDFILFPYIVGIAWLIDDIEQTHIIKPDGWEIPQEAIDIHGISQLQAINKGVDLKITLEKFFKDAADCDLLIGHGIYFDISIIKANALRLGMDKKKISDILHKDKRYDTMTKSMKYIKLGKYPKLSELYNFLFDTDFENQHSALGDVRATLKCYDELKVKEAEVDRV